MNRESYDAIAAQWDAARAGFVLRERDYLDALLDGLPAPAEILDLGCGTGRPFAEEILDRGHRVTGVDQSEALLAIARERYRDRPAATWIASTIESFESERSFDAVVCWDALFHVDRAWHEPLFARFAALLRPGGRLMLTFGGSAQPAFTDTMFGATFAYDSHPPETELALLARAGFVPVVSELMNPPTAGRDRGRYAVVARME